MAKTNPVDPSVPAGSEDPTNGDNRIRALAAAVAELLGVDHYMGSDGGAGVGYNEDAAGEHEVITLRAQTDPVSESGKGHVYVKTVSEVPELFFKDKDGNVIQLTIAGAIKKSVVQDSAFVPPGVMMAYGGAAAPTGWLLCDGSAVSRTTYENLFTAISTVYGIGDGSTTFNLPDLRGRVPVGLDAGNVNLEAADVLGSTGGEENHVLTEAELAAHTHYIASWKSGFIGTRPLMGLSDAGATIVTASTGSDSAHNNLQPYNTVNYIIKT